MSERIYQALTDDFIRRMRNWAKAGAGLLRSGAPISSIYGLGIRIDRYVSTEPPILLGEAADIDVALLSVPIRYRQAIRQFWQFEGLSLREHGRKLRKEPPLKYSVFEAWVIKGHEFLMPALSRHIAICRTVAAENAIRNNA